MTTNLPRCLQPKGLGKWRICMPKEANIDNISKHLLETPCCECATGSAKSLKSAQKPSRWTYEGSSLATPDPAYVNEDFSRSRSVQFKDIDIREFKLTLGNHPSATSCPHVMLDWEALPAHNVMELEDYK
jgi:hypothetical protein